MTDSAQLWGNAEFTHRLAELTWMAALPVKLHLNERSTGHPARDWLTAWAPRFMPGRDLRVLVLGCGEGWLERALARHEWIARIEACDFAAEAVARAQAMAPAKVGYRVLDLNRDPIEGTYDVVVAHQVLHHIENLEHAFDAIEGALTPEGTLLVNEYVGPNRFQYGDDVDSMINALLRALPAELRRSMLTGQTYEAKARPTVAEMIRNDPTEAVRAEELLPMIAARFEILDRRDLGGTILQHLLYDIVPNFRFEDPLARSLLELLCLFEGKLVDEGRIGSDFVIVAARKKGARVLPERKVELPPLPAEAFDRMRDPLWSAAFRGAPLTRPSATLSPLPRGEGNRNAMAARMYRLALLADMAKRTALNPRSRLAEVAWRTRLRLSGGDPFEVVANPQVRTLLEAMRGVYTPAL
jgi:2-polyprenyl-3-methyl-5-hydroxy-6-metoxy-1,4-benzoquinol methylase